MRTLHSIYRMCLTHHSHRTNDEIKQRRHGWIYIYEFTLHWRRLVLISPFNEQTNVFCLNEDSVSAAASATSHMRREARRHSSALAGMVSVQLTAIDWTWTNEHLIENRDNFCIGCVSSHKPHCDWLRRINFHFSEFVKKINVLSMRKCRCAPPFLLLPWNALAFNENNDFPSRCFHRIVSQHHMRAFK